MLLKCCIEVDYVLYMEEKWFNVFLSKLLVNVDGKKKLLRLISTKDV